MEAELKKIQDELRRTKAELWLLYEINNAMRTTLNLHEILYVILSAVTSHEGLGFNRAMLFLTSHDKKKLEGIMAIGPTNAEEAHNIWTQIAVEHLGLDDIVEMFHRIDSHVIKAPLHNVVKDIKIPMDESGGILAMCALEGMNFEAITWDVRQKINDPVLDRLKAELFVCIPLKGKHNIRGVLLVDNLITKKPITKDDIRVISMFAGQAGLAIDNAQLYEEIKFQAHTDSLTRLWNHGYFQNALAESINKAKGAGGSVVLALADLDNFKAYNDLLGHQKGDVALREISSILKAKMRSNDLVCRYGGEEFAIIMPGISKNEAFNIVERLRVAAEEVFQRTKKDIELTPITISAGIASFPHDSQDKEGLISRSDEALYSAKRNGKNKTVIYKPGID